MTQPENTIPSESSSPSATPAAAPGIDPATAAQMSFFEHVDELRVRLMRCLWVFMGGFAAFYCVAEKILSFLRRPLFEALPPEKRHLYFTSLFETFMVHLKIAGYASLVFLSPYFFYQLWGFISPGLKAREKKLVVPFVASASGFFIGGALFAYFILFPVGFKYFVHYGGPFDVPMLTIDEYYSLCLKLLLLFGVAFELPVFIVLLGVIGLVDAPTLRKQRRIAVIVISVISALFAPPDAVSMLILGGPLYMMFEGAIWVVQWMGAKRTAGTAEPEPENALVGKSR